mgnify:CR=1 FL=1
MSKYLLKTGLNIRLATQAIDYNMINSVVDFSEIEDEEIRERFIKSFLEAGYIEEIDGKTPVTAKVSDTEAKADEAGHKEDESEDDLEDLEEVEDEEEDKPAKKAVRGKGRK